MSADRRSAIHRGAIKGAGNLESYFGPSALRVVLSFDLDPPSDSWHRETPKTESDSVRSLSWRQRRSFSLLRQVQSSKDGSLEMQTIDSRRASPPGSDILRYEYQSV